MNIEGGRYYLKYHPDNPELREVLWNKPVSDTVGKAPKEGWKELPE
ncbi:hypothetical protein JMN32_02390 [Fulvivirga sp. 29W222]|uniref:Uncharacterized protein n=1 Tax=Fulvivirga marina TaxID=2494733 RepID=A0A937FT82_9BACT|nr:hypothetical protein [Fulvivirga marina]MBL6445139.1 hypothetical protein [Fulvivirga marina]